MQKSLFHILLITISSLILVANLSGQLNRFEIEYPHDKSIDAFGFDSIGFPWAMDIRKGKLDVIKFNGLQQLRCNFPKTLKGNYSGEVIFLDNKLMVANKDRIYLFDPSTESYETIWELPQNHFVDYSYQDVLGSIWIFVTDEVSDQSKVFRYDARTFVHIFDLTGELKKIKLNYQYGITDIDGELYFLYKSHGITKLDRNGNIQKLAVNDQEDFDNKVDCSVFKIDNENGIWRFHKDQIELLNTTTKEFESHPLSSHLAIYNPCLDINERLIIRLIFRAGKDRIWIGGEDSHLYLYETDSDRLTFFGKELVSNIGGQGGYIIKLLEDKSGNIWGRKRGGVFKITEKKILFEKYAVDTHKEDHPIYEDLPHINRTIAKYGKFGKAATMIYSICELSNGDIIFKDSRFIFKLDAKNNEVKILPTETTSGKIHLFANDSIKIISTWGNVFTLDDQYKVEDRLYQFKRLESIYQQSNGTLWYRGYLDEDYNIMFAKIDPSTLRYNGGYRDSNGVMLSDYGRVQSMTEDDRGNLWVTNYEGVFKINAADGLIVKQDSILKYEGKDVRFVANSSLGIHNIKDNLLGLGMETGLGILNAETFHLEDFVSKQDLGVDHISAALINEKSAWFSHGKKVSNYNFQTRELIHFSYIDGIDVGENFRLFKALSNGKIAAGTSNGLYIFHPDSLIDNHKTNIQYTNNTPLRLESHSTLDGRSDSVHTINYFLEDNDTAIELDHNDKMINLHFSLLNFDNVKEHKYAHWLEGYDNKWSKPVSDNTIRYTSLPSGKYTLKVRAHVGNGIWSLDTLKIPIIVLAPWYKRWWAYLIFALIVFGTAYLVYRYKVNQILKYQTLRTKISSDLHDDVGTLLSSLAMQSDVLGLDAPPEKMKRFEKFSSLSREAMDRMRDTVWAIDSKKDNMVSLIDRMADYVADIYDDQNIKIKFEHNVSKIYSKLAPDLRQNIYLIFKEALHNAIKHSSGDKINIKLTQTSNHLSLSITDNGTSSVIKSSGLGLSNMKMRAKRINGDLSISNENGFEVLLTITE